MQIHNCSVQSINGSKRGINQQFKVYYGLSKNEIVILLGIYHKVHRANSDIKNFFPKAKDKICVKYIHFIDSTSKVCNTKITLQQYTFLLIN